MIQLYPHGLVHKKVRQKVAIIEILNRNIIKIAIQIESAPN